MYLFLQNLRATLIPALAVPSFCWAHSAFLRCLAIRLIPDVVCNGAGDRLAGGRCHCGVENVERIMRDEGLPAREATENQWARFLAHWLPLRWCCQPFPADGLLWGIYGGNLSSVLHTIISAMLLSVVVALTLTPALAVPSSSMFHHIKKAFSAHLTLLPPY